MAANRVEAAGAEAQAVADNGADAEASTKEVAAPGTSGGFKAWLPLILTVLLMPVLAYGMTLYVLLPKVQHALASAEPTEAGAPAAESSKADPGKAEHAAAAKSAATAKTATTAKAAKEAAGKPKISVPLSKVLVNVSGSMGTRYLLATMTLVSSAPNFKEKIEGSKDQLLDLAANTLGSKTIADLEKPGARNLIRTELISVFNNAIGEGIVQEIYMTEFAIQ